MSVKATFPFTGPNKARMAGTNCWLAGLMLALAIGACGLPDTRRAAAEEPEGVSLTVVIDEQMTTYGPIAIADKSTVAEVLKGIAKQNDQFEFKSRGKGETFFVTEINKLKNEGARGRNWIFHVNGELGNRSAGVFAVKPGDKVEWKFQKYRP